MVPSGFVGPRSSRIFVPRRHGQVLLEPTGTVLHQAVIARRGKSAGWISSEPWPALAAVARRELYESLCAHAKLQDIPPPPADVLQQPWIITGHQNEFYHAGVWAKVLLADRLARWTGALAIDLLVDHDRVDPFGFVVPVRKGDRLQKELVRWAHASPLPAEQLSAPSAAARRAWIENIFANSPVRSDALEQFLGFLAEDSQPHLVPWLSGARRRFEISLGLNVWHVPCSRLCEGVAWTAFVLAWLREARAWSGAYNAALGRYRAARRISDPGRPMPDLLRTDQHIELPFWIYSDNQPRARLMLDDAGERGILYSDRLLPVASFLAGELIAAAPRLHEALARQRLHIRPRALTLTMFIRLHLSDLFIHGIGGALYDQITDEILRSIFQVCPSYACVSAGWLLPAADEVASLPDPARLRAQRHHLAHNPQLLIAAGAAASGSADNLLQERQETIERIKTSLREDRGRRRRDASNRLVRGELFRRLHAINERLGELAPGVMQDIESQIVQAGIARENAAVAAWREYFFALHSRESLRELLARIDDQMRHADSGE